jgi:cytochrome c553
VNRVGLWGILATGALVFLGSLVSFLWIPRAALAGPVPFFRAWCSALGIGGAAAQSGPPALPTVPTSDVVLNHDLLAGRNAMDVGLGATLALRCTMCHGPVGISFAGAPNLAGQYPIVLYKQLRDYRGGVRTSAVMTAMARNLSDIDMQRVSVYYASLPRVNVAPAASAAPAIVRWGDPMRNIAPCGSCHGTVDHTLASPWLGGEPASYIKDQLQAFASGERVNDINGQMRAMAQALTAQEIDTAATYYASHSP